jgi:hypothetical protein
MPDRSRGPAGHRTELRDHAPRTLLLISQTDPVRASGVRVTAGPPSERPAVGSAQHGKARASCPGCAIGSALSRDRQAQEGSS